MADGHGGAREGSGRKPGASTVKRIDPAVVNAGVLPLEMRLRLARHIWSQAIDETGKITDEKKAREACDIAEPALQFTSPRLASIAHSGPAGGAVEIDHRLKIDEAIDALIARETAAVKG